MSGLAGASPGGPGSHEGSRVGDLIGFASVPPVVVVSQVLDWLRRAEDLRARADLVSLLEGYYLTGPHNHHAFYSVLRSLAHPEGPGAAFLVRGAYGSGKTHLLAVLSLLCQWPEAWDHFLPGHSEARPYARCFSPERGLLVVHLPLDELQGAGRSLEELFFEQAEQELARRGIYHPLTDRSHFLALFEQYVLPRRRRRFAAFAGPDWEDLRRSDPEKALSLAHRFLIETNFPLRYRRSRSESLAALLEVMESHRLGGLVALVDELSLFLAAKTRPALDRDASFLQFLAQQTAAAPVWLICTLQRSLEEIGEVDSQTLRQIKDRFRRPLALTVSELRPMINRKLAPRRQPEDFRRQIRLLSAEVGDDLAACYPFHPASLACLEALAGALSRTRTLVELVGALERDGWLEQPWDRLVTPDLLLELLRTELESLPELASHARVDRFYQAHLGSMLGGPETGPRELAGRLIEALLLLSMAGLRWPVARLAVSLWDGRRRPDPGEVERVLRLLQRDGAYLEVSRRPGKLADEYFLEMESSAPEVVRRRLDETMASLGDRDRRVHDAALACCQQLPLGSLRSPRRISFRWLNSPRGVIAHCRELASFRPEELVNLAGLLASPRCQEDGALLVGELFGVERQRQSWEKARLENRLAPAILAWLPRPLSESELDDLKEYCALSLLLDDPGLGESEQGQQVGRRLAERRAALEIQVQQIVWDVYLHGELIDARGIRPVERLDDGQTFQELLAAAFAPGFAQLFPEFPAIAPSRPLPNRPQIAQLISGFIIPGAAEALPGSALESLLDGVLRPLGLVAPGELGQCRLQVELGGAAGKVLSTIGEQPARLSELERELAKSPLGLPSEMFELLAAALARRGYLEMLDGFLSPVAHTKLRHPLAEQAPFVRIAPLVGPSERKQLAGLAKALFGWDLKNLDLPNQQALWERLVGWRERELADATEVREQLDRLAQAPGQPRLEWLETAAGLEGGQAVLRQLDPSLSPPEGLRRLLEVAGRSLPGGPPELASYRELASFLRQDGALALSAIRLLADPRACPLPGSMLVANRARLGAMLANPEKLVRSRAAFRRLAEQHRLAHARQYQAWHSQAYAPARFRPYLSLREGAGWRALEAVSELGLAVSPGIREVEAALEAELARHCPGLGLVGALEQEPVCPACGLALGDTPQLRPPQEIEELISQGLRQHLAALASPARKALLERRVSEELAGGGPQGRDSQVLKQVAAVLKLPVSAAAEQALAAFTPPVVIWLSLHLRSQVKAERSLSALAGRLSGRELSKAEVRQALLEWLEGAEGLADDDYLRIG